MRALTFDQVQDALREGCVAVARCTRCDAQQAFPADSCFACGASDLALGRVPGAGTVYSWVVNHYAFDDEFRQQTPYVVVLVALAGGGRLYGRLEGLDGEGPSIVPDMAVALDTELTRQRGYPVFRARRSPVRREP